MEAKPQSELEAVIGYQFKNRALLTEALCHSSYANEKRGTLRCNERLEFLGDSVLSIVVSNHLFRSCTHLPEGELTKIRASLVCEKSLFEWAKQIGLGEYLLLGIARPVIKAHGSSDGEAFFHAARQAKNCVDGRICETIAEALAARKEQEKSEEPEA